MPMIGDDSISIALGRTLSALTARQRASAQNIANLETRNYKAKTVSFEDSLRGALRADDPAASRNIQVTYDTTTDPANGYGNNVQLDREMTTLTDTNLKYQMLSDAISSRFRGVRTVSRRD
jgi:flagellar basal-body rod protein FlgB